MNRRTLANHISGNQKPRPPIEIKKQEKKIEKPKEIEKPPKVEIKTVVKEVIKPISPIVKVIEQPDYSPVVEKNLTMSALLAEQAISSMRDTVNNNQVVMAEIARQIGHRPKEFLIQRDGSGDMVKIIPVYDDA